MPNKIGTNGKIFIYYLIPTFNERHDAYPCGAELLSVHAPAAISIHPQSLMLPSLLKVAVPSSSLLSQAQASLRVGGQDGGTGKNLEMQRWGVSSWPCFIVILCRSSAGRFP